MRPCRYPSALAATLLCFAALHYPSSCSAQVVSPNPPFHLATIDAETRWGFRAISPVTVGSPIIRLGDVVRPLDPNMAGWQRLRRAPIGLVPINGQPMTIRRDRLAQAIHDAEATPLAIDWVGPTEIKVVYRKMDAAEKARQTSATPGITQVAYEAPAATYAAASQPPLSEVAAKRVIDWIELAMERLLPSVAEKYRLEIDHRQAGLTPLRHISGVTAISAREQAHEGQCRFQLVGRSGDGPVETEIEITLSEHPTVVVPRRSLPRGHRIEANDLKLKPIPEEELDPSFVNDPEELIGLEVRGVVRVNHPILRGNVGAPILVHRGDLIEVRVLGGGIVVTTNAKSLGDGAASDEIDIETLQPRVRKRARVVQPGLVEIVTRAPKVTQ